MDKKDLIAKMKEVLKEKMSVDMDEVGEETDFVDYGISSQQYIQMLVTFENEFDIEFEEDELNINTLYNFNMIVECIENKLK